jgi:DNA-binding GntR family transcriptional regulator
VRETLRQAILEREIEPGGQININKVAEKLGVSSMPIREALRELEAEGMVTFGFNKRILASQLSRSELYDIYSIRIPLEEIALTKFFNLKDEQSLEDLEALHRQMINPRIIGNDWFNLNRAFHMKLYEMSGSKRLFKILQGLWNNTGPYLRIFSDNKKAVDRANKEHGLLLQALRKQNCRQAQRVLRKHLQNGIRTIESSLDGVEGKNKSLK